MSNWIEIANEEDLPPGKVRECVAAGKIIALFRIDDQFYAMDGLCPHHGGPLGRGILQGCVVTCPWHGWRFDVTDGAYQSNQTLFQKCYPVKVERGKVLVNLEETADNPG